MLAKARLSVLIVTVSRPIWASVFAYAVGRQHLASRFAANPVAAAIPVETDELMAVRTTDLPRIDMAYRSEKLQCFNCEDLRGS